MPYGRRTRCRTAGCARRPARCGSGSNGRCRSSCWPARPALWEPHHVRRRCGRLTLEGTRFVQAGRCEGWIRIGGEEIRLSAGEWTGTRDRSWGVRPIPSETLLFDIEHPEPPVLGCALRLAADPAANTVFPVYDMPRQYRTTRLVAEHSDLPVPRVLWLEEGSGPLGPFFVMARAEGRVPPDVMPCTYEGNWLHSASDEERAHLESASVALLARLHDHVPAGAAGFLELPGEGSPLRRHVAARSAYYAWVVDGLARSPLIEAGFDRLDGLWPHEEGDAVLDREMAALAPREVDLGWTVYLHRFFQDLTVRSAKSQSRRIRTH